MKRPFSAAERLLQLFERLGIVVIPVDIAQQTQELVEFGRVGAPVLLDAVFRPFLELFDCPPGLGDSDDGDVDAFISDQAQERRENLFEGEIAGGAEEHQSVGLGGLHLISCGVEIGISADRR